MSKELNKAPVEQAGGDERAAFFKHLIGRHPAHETEIVRVVEHNHAAWKAWQARAALAQPSPAQAEQAEAERPPQPERYTADVFHPERPYYTAQTSVVRASDFDEFATQYERIVGALRFERQQMDRAFTACINERDAALARVAGLRSLLNPILCYVENDIERMRGDRDKSDNKEIYDLAISLAMERLKAAQHAVFTTEPGCDTAVELASHITAQAQHSVPEEFSFEYRHPNGECHTVTVSREQVINEMPDFLFEALCSKFCNCEPVGETNVVECRCDEYAEEFKLIAAAPGNEGV
ncbi:hypothetical protein [Pseudomonas aeruginosa]|uniref:hypothetical protein n=1 Tax=Pseudomonas aeruginosa TaxID=287 RepID=UPI001680F095|nr:hypothetical protein [Pseudomonas aeruginosa]